METPFKSGDEFDILTKARRIYNFRPSLIRKVKRGYNKRARREVKKRIFEDLMKYEENNINEG